MPASFAQTVDATAAAQLVDPPAATIVATLATRGNLAAEDAAPNCAQFISSPIRVCSVSGGAHLAAPAICDGPAAATNAGRFRVPDDPLLCTQLLERGGPHEPDKAAHVATGQENGQLGSDAPDPDRAFIRAHAARRFHCHGPSPPPTAHKMNAQCSCAFSRAPAACRARRRCRPARPAWRSCHPRRRPSDARRASPESPGRCMDRP